VAPAGQGRAGQTPATPAETPARGYSACPSLPQGPCEIENMGTNTALSLCAIGQHDPPIPELAHHRITRIAFLALERFQMTPSVAAVLAQGQVENATVVCIIVNRHQYRITPNAQRRDRCAGICDLCFAHRIPSAPAIS